MAQKKVQRNPLEEWTPREQAIKMLKKAKEIEADRKATVGSAQVVRVDKKTVKLIYK